MNGYEGTGRSLSLKLIQQLREQASGAGAAAAAKGGSSSSRGLAAATASGGAVGRTFREVTLEEPIRCVTVTVTNAVLLLSLFLWLCCHLGFY